MGQESGYSLAGASDSGSLTGCGHLKALVGEEFLPGLLRWLLAGLTSSLGVEQRLLCHVGHFTEALTTRQEKVREMEARVLW